MEVINRLSLDKGTQGRIHEANIILHRFEAKYYRLVHPEIYNTDEQKRLVSTLKKVDKLIETNLGHVKKALDFGAGTGNLTGKLLNMGYTVTAIDISREMCEILEKKYEQYLISKQLTVLNSPIEKVNFDKEFDLITCYSVLHHLPDYIKTLRRLSGFLKKGGVMYLDHEKSPFYWENEPKMLANFVKLVFFHSNLLLNALCFRLKRVDGPSFDYSLSDYWHKIDHHLDHRKIRHMFENEQYRFNQRVDYYIKQTWFLNPFFHLYKYFCRPETSLWVAKK